MSTCPVLALTRYSRPRDSSSTMSDGVPVSLTMSPNVAPVVCGQLTRADARKQRRRKERLKDFMGPDNETPDRGCESRRVCKDFVKCLHMFVKATPRRNPPAADASKIGQVYA